MDHSPLVALVQKQLGIYDADFTPSGDTSSSSVAGTILGHKVTIEFTKTNDHPDYDYNVDALDESGEPLSRGNGGPTWEMGISIYQWQGVVAELRRRA